MDDRDRGFFDCGITSCVHYDTCKTQDDRDDNKCDINPVGYVMPKPLPKAVALISLGYRWTCTNCLHPGHEDSERMDINCTVVCEDCGHSFGICSFE